MYAERQARYPKGTYKIMFSKQNDTTLFCLINLSTGMRSSSSSIWELIKTIENDISVNKYPQSGIQYRSWSSPAQNSQAAEKTAGQGAEKAQVPECCNTTFIVNVLYRQNATWQGTIRWMEGRQTRPYRSVNELLKLMDEAAGYSPEEIKNRNIDID